MFILKLFFLALLLSYVSCVQKSDTAIGIRNFDTLMDLKKNTSPQISRPKILHRKPSNKDSQSYEVPTNKRKNQKSLDVRRKKKPDYELVENEFRIGNLTNKKKIISILDKCINNCVNFYITNSTNQNFVNSSFYNVTNVSQDVFFNSSYINALNLAFINTLDTTLNNLTNSSSFYSCTNFCKTQYKKYTFDYKKYIEDLENILDSHPKDSKKKGIKIYFNDIKYAFSLYYKNLKETTKCVNCEACEPCHCIIPDGGKSRISNDVCYEESCDKMCENKHKDDYGVAICDYYSSCTCYSKGGKRLDIN